MQAASDSERAEWWAIARRARVFLPVLAIAAILAVVALVGFRDGAGVDREQVKKEVATLLAGIPQNDATLGSPDAPMTLRIYGDLQCPTVRFFVASHLRSLIDNWVRPGALRLEYRSLETDTINEGTFFEQEIAALAAGKQDRMWDFLLTFVLEQGEHFSAYADEEFLTDVASQVPSLNRGRWRLEREDASLARRVALGVHSARARGLTSTPAFVIDLGGDSAEGQLDELKATLESITTALSEESERADLPTLEVGPKEAAELGVG